MNFLCRRLPNRRASETFEVEAQSLKFTTSVSRYTDGTPAEIFLCNHKASSAAGIFAASIALRYGVALDRLATFDQEVA